MQIIIREELRKALTNDNFSKAERNVIECEYPNITHPSNFVEKLVDLCHACDEDNLNRLSLAFPEMVQAIRDKRSGLLRKKLELYNINLSF